MTLTYREHIESSARSVPEERRELDKMIADHLSRNAGVWWAILGDDEHDAMPPGADGTDFSEALDRFEAAIRTDERAGGAHNGLLNNG